MSSSTAVSMNEWSELLDRLVAHQRALAEGEQRPMKGEPPFVKSLAVPYPDMWKRGRVTSTWPVDARFINERGVLFGGFLAALSDHAMGMVTMSVLETGETFATSDLRVSFFKPVTEGTLAIEARMVHRSHNMVHTEVVLARENGQLIAKASATQAILRS